MSQPAMTMHQQLLSLAEAGASVSLSYSQLTLRWQCDGAGPSSASESPEGAVDAVFRQAIRFGVAPRRAWPLNTLYGEPTGGEDASDG